MNNKNSKVDFYFTEDKAWQKEYVQLRSIILDCGLIEELKWGQPCYCYQGHNIVLIHGFKEYCAILFIKGALLKDSNGILIQQTENVQSARQLRFTNVVDIMQQADVIKAYIQEAIAIAQAGLKVDLKKTKEYAVPEEFQQQLDNNAALNKAFKALTNGRQRGYLLHFSAPKLAKTREARVAKSINNILNGKGLND